MFMRIGVAAARIGRSSDMIPTGITPQWASLLNCQGLTEQPRRVVCVLFEE